MPEARGQNWNRGVQTSCEAGARPSRGRHYVKGANFSQATSREVDACVSTSRDAWRREVRCNLVVAGAGRPRSGFTRVDVSVPWLTLVNASNASPIFSCQRAHLRSGDLGLSALRGHLRGRLGSLGGFGFALHAIEAGAAFGFVVRCPLLSASQAAILQALVL